MSSRAALSILALWFDSCSLQEKASHLDPFSAINPFQNYDPLAPNSPLAAAVVAQWEQELSKPGFLEDDQWHTKKGRDELVYRLIFIADYRFFKYEGDLMAGRAAGDTVTDMAVLGLTSAAALTPYAQTGRILSAIAGGLIGSRAALQKNFFQNQTVSVLLDRMRALRQERFNQLVANLQLPYQRYPVELAIVEVFDYFNRGTMLGALQDISNTTAIKQITAEGGDVTSPPTALPVSKQIRISLPQSISTQAPPLAIIRLSPDAQRRKKALGDEIASLEKNGDYSTASKILETYGITPVPSGEDALVKLRGLLAAVKSKEALIPLEHAFKETFGQLSNSSLALPQTSPSASPTPEVTPAPSVPLSTPHGVATPNGSLLHQH